MGSESGGTPASATITRWARLFVITGVGFFVAWHFATLADYPRSATVSLGLFGFVFHVVFGKAYALVPSYFARDLAVPRAPSIHLPMAALGTVGAFFGTAVVGSAALEAAGLFLWFVGCLVFVATIGWTIGDDPTGSETGTGNVDADRKRVDRVANAVVPLVLAYLFVGSSLALAATLGSLPGLPGLFSLTGPAVTHLLAAGTATLSSSESGSGSCRVCWPSNPRFRSWSSCS
ncbi:hypothetical protein [Halobiforma nitratireducens]|uniref:hypothetical protein n=1 Tax=Halobiforma nitratireducens TaxID=130048 RepID=UPI001EF9FD9D|nr:hypothetical protein [Halobiforma nitratireducens]